MSKSREVGIKIHKGIGAAGRGLWSGLKGIGKGVKIGAVAVKEVAVGAVTGRTEAEQRQLELDLKVEKAERMQLEPGSKLYEHLTGNAETHMN